MDYLQDYVGELVVGNETAALWSLIAIAALWGCLLGVTAVLAIQEHAANRSSRKDQVG